ncbi:MAG: M50 family metallopeptidase [Clostridia bacterium]|nr:M50 family metallopeptidase [Clostridia bacterium]
MVFSIIVTVIAFGIMVILHEAGHFLTAKRFGVTVHEFSIGMGPLVLKKVKGETQYSIRLLPLGGYVKLEDENEENDDPRAFGNIHPLKRIVILAAGAAMNVLLGFLCFVIITAAQGSVITTSVGGVTEGGGAETAGIEAGDVIKKLDNTSIGTYADMRLFLLNAEDTVSVTVLRNGERMCFDVSVSEKDGVKYLGVQLLHKTDLNVLDVVKYSYYDTRYVVRAVFFSLKQFFTGGVSVKDLSGPVGIVQVVDETAEAVAETGGGGEALWLSLLYLFGMISVNLGVFNLLPFPALDGGSIIFAFIELVTRKKQNKNILGYINLMGLALILGLGIYVMWSDIMKLISG